MHVLIVEDEAGAAAAMAQYLRLRGHDVITAGDAPAALRAAARMRPDALIADWRLGHEMDGVELARALRAQRPDMAVVLISAYAGDELRQAAGDLPRVDILSKPLELRALADLVESSARA